MQAKRSVRAAWHRPANAIVLGYLGATIGVAAYQRTWPPPWLVIHLFLLGATTNAIVIWTAHFATTLLVASARARAAADSQLAVALGVLNLGVLLVLTSAPHGATPGVVVGAAMITAAIVARAGMLTATLARAGGARFGPVVRFYIAAAIALVMGVAAGTALEVGVPPSWHARVYAAHVELNVFGWIAFTVLGTQAAFWPMVLRTRIVSGTEIATRHALPVCVAGLIATVGGLLADSRPIAAAGVCVYILGAIRALEPFARTALQRAPRSPAALMLGAAMCWFLAGLAADLGKVIAARDLTDFAAAIAHFVPWLATGFVVQIVMGALTYLLPVVLGGGPAGGRRLSDVLDRHGVLRVAGFNVGTLIVAAAPGGVPTAIGWSLVGAAVTVFCLVAAVAVATSRRSPQVAAGQHIQERHQRNDRESSPG